jgi:hypothetical protein
MSAARAGRKALLRLLAVVEVERALARRDYSEASPGSRPCVRAVDGFFDNVMVTAETRTAPQCSHGAAAPSLRADRPPTWMTSLANYHADARADLQRVPAPVEMPGFSYCVITPFLSFRGRFWMAGVMTHVVFFAARILCGIRYTVEGRENLPPGNHVIFMKHSSTWETFGIMILFPPLVWVMKREILWIPFVGWGCLLASCIAIDRKAGASAVNQVLAHKDRMARGAWILVFRRHAHGRGRNAPLWSSGTVSAQRTQDCSGCAQRGYFWPAAACSRSAAPFA